MPLTIPVHQFSPSFLASSATSLAASSSFEIAPDDPKSGGESCDSLTGTFMVFTAVPFLWWGLRWLSFGRKSLEEKYETIIGLLLTGREMYGRDIAKESHGRINPGSVYVFLDRLERRGIIESWETPNPPDRKGPPRRLYRLAVPPKEWPSYLSQDEVVLPRSEGRASHKFFPLEIEISETGCIRLHNRSDQHDPVLYSVKFGRRFEVGLPGGSYSVILGTRAMIYSSDGSTYWLCVKKDLCRLVKIKRVET